MTKRIAFACGVLGFLAVGGMAFAQTASTATSGAASTPARPPMVLQVGPAGKVLLRGTIDSVSATSITVKSWGGDWTINVPSTAEVLPQGAALSSFQQGDLVGVLGTVSESGSWTIDATLVRDWTARQAIQQERQTNIQSVRETMQSETPRNYQGTAGSVNGLSMPFGIGGTSYTVNVAANAQIVNRNWLTIQLSAIQNGDTVRVWGQNASGTITAEIVRDISIPAAGTNPAQEQLQGAPRH